MSGVINGPVLEVKDFSVSFIQSDGAFGQRAVKVMEGIELAVDEGEILAVVGSSGSGKSLLAHAILGILPDNAQVSGTIRYRGETLHADKLSDIRGKELAFVPQSVNYLDPLMRVGAQVRIFARGQDPVSAQRSVFKRYRLPESVERIYPFQLSGGMARKVLVSTATVSKAKLIVADEPTPGMHPDDARETFQQFRELADEGCAVLLITHDLEGVLPYADKVAVLYAGTVVEIAPAEDFTGGGERLRHPYSQALWKALPQNGFVPSPGSPPRLGDWPPGCLFSPRCPLVVPECKQSRPKLRTCRGGWVRCIHDT